MKNNITKIAWKDYVYYETDKELYNELNSIGVAYFKNNKWSLYLSFQHPDSYRKIEDIEDLIEEAMSECNVKRENIKLVIPPSHIECEEISAGKYIRKLELDKLKKAEKRIKQAQKKLKEQQKNIAYLKKATIK